MNCMIINNHSWSSDSASSHLSGTRVRYRCSKCDKHYASRQHLMKHMDVIHTKRSKIATQSSTARYTSSKVSKTKRAPVRKKTSLPNRDKFMEKVEVWVCTICYKEYASKGNLKKHILTAHEQTARPVPRVQKFRCRHCGAEYSSHGGLRRHVAAAHERLASSISVSTSTKVVKKSKASVTINVFNPVGRY